MEKTISGDNTLVNLSEASRRLEISYVTLWRWIKKGKVTPVRILGLPYLTLDQVESLKKEMNKQATGKEERDARKKDNHN